VLHFARAERRLVRVQLGECPLAPIVEDVAAAFVPVAAARGAVIRLRVQPDIAAVTDADALRHVLLNLLDNAARYGPRGQQITLGAAREGDWVRLWVDDEGPGVPPEERVRIWEPFVRLPSAAGTVSVGSGIGLAVVREIVTLLGGRVGVEGAPERGAHFFVLLPSVRHSGATAPPSRAEPTEPARSSDPHRGSVA
jgi:signal transduction histidine kinase